MINLVPQWVRKRFCFPCQVRTRMLKTALAESREALELRQRAQLSLKEYVDERPFAQRAHN